VHLASVDVADEDSCALFWTSFAEGWPPIRGVVHAAGVLQDGLLVQLDAAALNTVLRPKMMGGCCIACLKMLPWTSSYSSLPRVPCWASLVRGTMPQPTPSWMLWRITEEPKASQP
jgi:hypothetical protein